MEATRSASGGQWGVMTRLEFLRQLAVAHANATDREERGVLFNNITLFKLMTDEEWMGTEQIACQAQNRNSMTSSDE
jgi:hypothetical protein